jgi:hypothetical protein
MTALAADRRNTNSASSADRGRVGKVAGSVIIYKGAALCWNSSGYLVPAANTAGFKFAGWAEQAVNTTGIADGVSEVLYRTGLSMKMKSEATAAIAQANVGGPCWIHDDQTVRSTPGNGVLCGVVEQIESDGEILVYGAPEAALGHMVEQITLAYDHAQVTADTTIKLYKVPAGKKLRVIGIDYINPTGLAEDAANYFNVKVLKDATVMANWSTETGQQGTIAADTFVALVNSATDADLVAAAAAIVALFLDETGAATLPAGRVVIRALLLPAG